MTCTPARATGWRSWHNSEGEKLFTCIRCQDCYHTDHLPQPVTECPVCGYEPFMADK